MHARTIKIGAGLVAALAFGTLVAPTGAFADYAPAPKDVVGVGSDTLQALGDFVADGSYTADNGFNTAGNKFKFISIDATADANTRLAYGPGGANGLGTATTTSTTSGGVTTTTTTDTAGCGAGTGSLAGTANSGTADTNPADFPCVLSPTVTLRAGTSPEQRPNGSGAGYNLLKADTDPSTGAAVGNGNFGIVNFSRSSSAKNGNNANIDSITVGTDTLAMLAAGGTASTNAVPLSKAQLKLIYSCDPGATRWNQVGGTSADAIYPMIPQVGSGTRSTFLADIGAPTLGSCVHNVEENDPQAIADSGHVADAIEPVSGSRLNLFNGVSGVASQGNINGGFGYFNDNTCPYNPQISNLSANSSQVTNCKTTKQSIVPQVAPITSGSPSDGGAVYVDNRNLYIYFRDADIFSGTTWQPGGTLNWVRTMFYNPCTASITSKTILSGSAATAAGCTIGNQGNLVGPGGDPYFASAAGQQDIADSGVTPAWAYSPAAA
ncbi:hypothetical protein [Jatrophihabitans sp.]|uniref:hypothetical protein n=1 Tax=Jatrophihabitans sp. TaxID=1932789 RepID=UPI0030C688E5|nr:hypothetical protein [Jatrophihabitans sp.]